MQTTRLNMIISHTVGGVIADVGTDHGYIPVRLVQDGLCDKVIATDLNRGPLSAAEHNVKANGCEDSVELRLGSGLTPLAEGECGTIIIAGMGGELISDILLQSEKIAKSADMLLLQPMNSQDLLRGFLYDNGYRIVEEDIATEGFKVYNLIIAKKGTAEKPDDEFELQLPSYLYSHDKFPALLRKKKREFEKILHGLTAAKEPNDDEIGRYKKLLGRIYELEEKYESI